MVRRVRENGLVTHEFALSKLKDLSDESSVTMCGKLKITSGPDTGLVYNLQPNAKGIIGRSAGCAIRLSDKSVSRQHCQLFFDGTVVSVIDLNSRSGTRVNGTRVRDADLAFGDVLSVGQTRLAFFQHDAEEASTLDEDTISTLEEKRRPVPEDLSGLVGQLFLRYQVQSVISKARSGVVFEAIDLARGDSVALKVFWPDFTGDNNQTRRFLRAVRTMLPVKHTNIVSLRAAGAIEKHCFTASEFVEGDSAADLVRRTGIAGRMNWQVALKIGLQITRALVVADDIGIVHRNISPTNILVARNGEAKLGDLVLAKALEATGYQQITRPGETIGQLAYMALEQLTDARLVDARTDIYNLGATLYALLTGEPPNQAATVERTIHNIRVKDPEPPSVRQLGIPGAFEGIVMKMMSKRREGRYQTAAALATDFSRARRMTSI